MRHPFPLPELSEAHVQGARLYANRVDALAAWPKNSCVAEIGVAFGGFSSLILREVCPVQFDAYDTFVLHRLETMWGKPTAETLGGKTHRQYYEDSFSDAISSGQVRVFEGDSSDSIARRDRDFYDLIYIDGDHSYAGVLRDTTAATAVLKPGGVLVFNDYILYDDTGSKYGVVPVVNDLCVNRGWTVKYLTLQSEMFCDIALVRADGEATA